ncbi:hypothetical protein KGQ20_44915 [Catenulispora sp. NF23]|uniref:hypothetical protein n=1 Tax=Catenulispora pinistramenti TaxID=2705254 RepID=UPI001BA66986|nr:hypothetical protein [Catenulispora pinistramenti]MBS2539908.1 hypothetical protein [Catenulispora pinistramenti]
MSPEPVALAVGGSLVAVAAVRGVLTRVGVRRQLRVALVAADPAARVAAVQTAGENGVGRNARLLLEIAEAEEDIWVRQALAQTVMRHRWEPACTVALVRLRVWAKQELLWGRLEMPAGSALEGGGSASVRTATSPSLTSTGWWEQ